MTAGQKDEPQDHLISIRGKAYTLRFSVRAWAALVKLWGLNSVQEAQQRLTEIGDATQTEPIVDIFWAAMQRHHPDVTREQADDLADDMGVENLAGVLPKLIRASGPPGDAGGAKKKTARPNRR